MTPIPPTLRDEINIVDSPLDINPLEFRKGFLGGFFEETMLTARLRAAMVC